MLDAFPVQASSGAAICMGIRLSPDGATSAGACVPLRQGHCVRTPVVFGLDKPALALTEIAVLRFMSIRNRTAVLTMFCARDRFCDAPALGHPFEYMYPKA
jgi:hypothetical protein